MHVELNWSEISIQVAVALAGIIVIMVIGLLVSSLLEARRRRHRNCWLAIAAEQLKNDTKLGSEGREIHQILFDELTAMTADANERDALLYRAREDLSDTSRTRYGEFKAGHEPKKLHPATV